MLSFTHLVCFFRCQYRRSLHIQLLQWAGVDGNNQVGPLLLTFTAIIENRNFPFVFFTSSLFFFPSSFLLFLFFCLFSCYYFSPYVLKYFTALDRRLSSAAQPCSYFGYAVALYDYRVTVGAYGYTDSSGNIATPTDMLMFFVIFIYCCGISYYYFHIYYDMWYDYFYYLSISSYYSSSVYADTI